MISKMLLTFCVGMAMHRTETWIDYVIKATGWNRLTKYTIGVLSAFPFVVLLFNDVEGVESDGKRLTIAYFLAYLSYGLGTSSGYLLSEVKK